MGNIQINPYEMHTNKQRDNSVPPVASGARARERERERETDRQTDRQADRQAGRQTDRQTNRQTGRQTENQTDTQGQRDTKTERQREQETKRKAEKERERVEVGENIGDGRVSIFCIAAFGKTHTRAIPSLDSLPRNRSNLDLVEHSFLTRRVERQPLTFPFLISSEDRALCSVHDHSFLKLSSTSDLPNCGLVVMSAVLASISARSFPLTQAQPGRVAVFLGSISQTPFSQQQAH